jgi:uncharacterized protein (TIGR00156 family)
MKMKTMAIMAASTALATVTFAAEPVINSGALNKNTSAAVNQSALFQTVTVQKATTLADDSKVQIKGYVVKSLGKEKYQFRDATGSITVEIDDDLWQGKAVSAKTPITIQGEVDVDMKPTKKVEIDVDRVIF